MDYYNAIIADKKNALVEVRQVQGGATQTISGSGEVRILEVGLFDDKGHAVELVRVGQPVELRIKAEACQAVPQLVMGYVVKDRLGQNIYGTNTWHTGQILNDVDSGQLITYFIQFPANLGAGTYSVSVAMTQNDTHLEKNFEWRDLALVFTVVNADKTYFVGNSWLEPKIEIQSVSETQGRVGQHGDV